MRTTEAKHRSDSCSQDANKGRTLVREYLVATRTVAAFSRPAGPDEDQDPNLEACGIAVEAEDRTRRALIRFLQGMAGRGSRRPAHCVIDDTLWTVATDDFGTTGEVFLNHAPVGSVVRL